MSGWVYIFAGKPQSGLNAGGIQFCFETVEKLGELEHDPLIQYRRGGTYFGENKNREWVGEANYRLSDSLLNDGITWDWFGPTFQFGNGVNTYNEYAGPEYKTVVKGTDFSIEEYIKVYGELSLQNALVHKQLVHDGWKKWEARWAEGKCPSDYVNVQLTWLVTTHKLPPFAYERVRSIIEDGAVLKEPKKYSQIERRNKGTLFSKIKPFDGKSRLKRY